MRREEDSHEYINAYDTDTGIFKTTAYVFDVGNTDFQICFADWDFFYYTVSFFRKGFLLADES